MNFLGMGPMELLLIVVLALIVFGPAKLPEIMGQVGKAIGDFRRATSELSDEFNRTIQAELQETKAIVDDTKSTRHRLVCGHQRRRSRGDRRQTARRPAPRRGGRRPTVSATGPTAAGVQRHGRAPSRRRRHRRSGAGNRPRLRPPAAPTLPPSEPAAAATRARSALWRPRRCNLPRRAETRRRDDLLPPY